MFIGVERKRCTREISESTPGTIGSIAGRPAGAAKSEASFASSAGRGPRATGARETAAGRTAVASTPADCRVQREDQCRRASHCPAIRDTATDAGESSAAAAHLVGEN